MFWQPLQRRTHVAPRIADLEEEAHVVGMAKLRSEAMKHEVAPRPSVDSRCATRPPNVSQFTDRSQFKTDIWIL